MMVQRRLRCRRCGKVITTHVPEGLSDAGISAISICSFCQDAEWAELTTPKREPEFLPSMAELESQCLRERGKQE